MFGLFTQLLGFQTQGSEAADKQATSIESCSPENVRYVVGNQYAVCGDGNQAGRWDTPHVPYLGPSVESQIGEIR